MIYRIYGQKDATIYEEDLRTSQNTGVDEILEVTKFFDADFQLTPIGNSRILSRFDITAFSQSIVDGDVSANANFYLNLTSTEQSEVRSEYDLFVYPLYETWSEGIGQYYYNPKVTDAVSWLYKDGVNAWSVGDASTFNETVIPKIPTTGIVLYEGFATSSTGSAYLTESINDVNGNEPTAFVENNMLIISASNYSGTTLVFPIQLDETKTYGIQFQINPQSFDTIDFKIKDPSGALKTDDDYSGMISLITVPVTQSFEITSTDAGDYELRFAFFDNQGPFSTNTIHLKLLFFK